METLIYLLKAHLLFIILGGLYHFFLRSSNTFHLNRFYLLAIYGVSITAPLLEIKVRSNSTFLAPSYINQIVYENVTDSSNAITQNGTLSIDMVVPWLYTIMILLSIGLFLFRFTKSYRQFNLFKRDAEYDHEKEVYWVKDCITPFTFLDKTLLPVTLKNDPDLNIIINHEEEHRKKLHFIDILFTEFCSCLLILSPLNRRIKKYVTENHEFLADRHASSTIDKSAYTKILIQKSITQQQLQLVSHFAKPTILNRLNMLQNTKKSNLNPFFAMAFLVITGSIFSCDINPSGEFILNQAPNTENEKSTVEVDENDVYSKTDIQAAPRDGLNPFYDHISEQLATKYPEEAINNGIEGVVYLQFVIEKDGSITNAQSLKGIGYGCDEAAINALKSYGSWTPAKHEGNRVRSKRVIPIRFALN